MDMTGGLIIGIDIQEEYSQICYYDVDNGQPQNVLFADGRAVTENPVKLSAWDQDADKTVQKQVTEQIAGLIASVKKVSKVPRVEKICVTVSLFQKEILDMIAAAMEGLMYAQEQWTVIGHEECYAFYAYHQKKELYASGVMLLDYEEDGIHAHIMQDGKHNETHFIMESSHVLDNAQIRGVYAGEQPLAEIETMLISWLKEITANSVLSSVYLTGKGFDIETFPPELTKFLCARRKVFAGQNLFVKGACYCALEEKGSAALEGVILGCRNRVTTGIEVDILERGSAKRLRIVKPGVNWYMAGRKMDFILEDMTKVSLIMRPCDGSGDYQEVIELRDFPYRAGKMTRIELDIRFLADDRCVVNIRDKGFGEFVKSSGKIICREIQLRS